MFADATKTGTSSTAPNSTTAIGVIGVNPTRVPTTITKLHVKSLPTLFGIQLSIGDLRAFIQELREAKGRIQMHSVAALAARRPSFVTRCLNSLACKSAIKFGQSLSRLECQQLVARLGQTKLPFQCAHGRPTVVPIALGDVSQGMNHVWKKSSGGVV